MVARKADAGFNFLNQCNEPTPIKDEIIPITAKNKGSCNNTILSAPNADKASCPMVAAMADEAIMAPQ